MSRESLSIIASAYSFDNLGEPWEIYFWKLANHLYFRRKQLKKKRKEKEKKRKERGKAERKKFRFIISHCLLSEAIDTVYLAVMSTGPVGATDNTALRRWLDCYCTRLVPFFVTIQLASWWAPVNSSAPSMFNVCSAFDFSEQLRLIAVDNDSGVVIRKSVILATISSFDSWRTWATKYKKQTNKQNVLTAQPLT